MLSNYLTPERIKEIRDKSGYTREEIAELMNVSAGTVVNWESRKKDGNAKSVMSMSEFERFMTITATGAEERKERRKLFGAFEAFLSKSFR
ncbi:MAG: helix-turn-helix domain-containing protein [Aestuariibacter sp.]